MQGVLVAPFAIFLFLKLLCCLFLVNQRNVVAALTFCALKTDDISHLLSLQTKNIIAGGRLTDRPAFIIQI